MPTLKFQVDQRNEKPFTRNVTTAFVIAFSMFMVIGRLTAGVHWATDIIGAVLLSFGLFRLYQYFVQLAELHGEKYGVQ
jgi:undecaprenyl-diphosphatase